MAQEFQYLGAGGTIIRLYGVGDDPPYRLAVDAGDVAVHDADGAQTASEPHSYNVTLTLANTEYNQAMPVNCRYFEFQARTAAAVRYAFATGHVAASVAPFHTLKANDYYYSPDLNQRGNPSTLYLATGAAGTVVEILVWT